MTSFSLEAGTRAVSGRSSYRYSLVVRSKTATDVPEPAMPCLSSAAEMRLARLAEATPGAARSRRRARPVSRRGWRSVRLANFCTESSSCFTATAMAFRLVYGQMAGPDLRNARCALVWSGNPFHSRTPGAGPLMDVVDRGTKLIVVDPRRTQLASQGDHPPAAPPGTDGACAGFAHVILEEGLHDAGFVAAHTKGFAEYRDYVRRFDPERVEGITGCRRRRSARPRGCTRPPGRRR